jgi:hypothetical protein
MSERPTRRSGASAPGAGEPGHFWQGVGEASRFFLGESRVENALHKLVAALDAAQIPYAIVGGMALNAFGYRRVTVDVDVLLTAEGLAAFKTLHLGRGYVERFPGGRGLRDTENNVDIDVLLAGGYPGDGKPKPVAFPDPSMAVREGGVALLPLPKLIELKLASGLSAPHRLRDLADVLELIRATGVPPDAANDLDPSVRDKFRELWQAAQSSDPE